jgi:hypothetical protein
MNYLFISIWDQTTCLQILLAKPSLHFAVVLADAHSCLCIFQSCFWQSLPQYATVLHRLQSKSLRLELEPFCLPQALHRYLFFFRPTISCAAEPMVCPCMTVRPFCLLSPRELEPDILCIKFRLPSVGFFRLLMASLKRF